MRTLIYTLLRATSSMRDSPTLIQSAKRGGNETARDVDRRIKLVTRESERQVLVESRERVHRR